MNDIRKLLESHTRWQKERAGLSWEETIRIVEGIRESVIQLRSLRKKAPGPPAKNT